MDLLDDLRTNPPHMYVVASDDDLEDDGTLETWHARVRNPDDFQRNTRVRTSPKRVGDSIRYGTVISEKPLNNAGDWMVSVHWDNGSTDQWVSAMVFRYDPVRGQLADTGHPTTDIRSLYPLETY